MYSLYRKSEREGYTYLEWDQFSILDRLLAARETFMHLIPQEWSVALVREKEKQFKVKVLITKEWKHYHKNRNTYLNTDQLINTDQLMNTDQILPVIHWPSGQARWRSASARSLPRHRRSRAPYWCCPHRLPAALCPFRACPDPCPRQPNSTWTLSMSRVPPTRAATARIAGPVKPGGTGWKVRGSTRAR